MAKSEEVLHLFNRQKGEFVARIILNGYDIRAGICNLPHGHMRSFRIVSGDLWDDWSIQSPLVISDDEGNEAQIRVAALPTDEGSSGLIEFL